MVPRIVRPRKRPDLRPLRIDRNPFRVPKLSWRMGLRRFSGRSLQSATGPTLRETVHASRLLAGDTRRRRIDGGRLPCGRSGALAPRLATEEEPRHGCRPARELVRLREDPVPDVRIRSAHALERWISRTIRRLSRPGEESPAQVLRAPRLGDRIHRAGQGHVVVHRLQVR